MYISYYFLFISQIKYKYNITLEIISWDIHILSNGTEYDILGYTYLIFSYPTNQTYPNSI